MTNQTVNTVKSVVGTTLGIAAPLMFMIATAPFFKEQVKSDAVSKQQDLLFHVLATCSAGFLLSFLYSLKKEDNFKGKKQKPKVKKARVYRGGCHI
tara:strand:+ start:908 stop:1195 length:288 start_codon:yes stop_codon:yes gene_type:complete